MSEQQVLPELTGKLDFTDRQRAITLADDFQDEMHDATFVIVERERQLRTTLASLAQSEAERQGLLEKYDDAMFEWIADQKQLRAERERLQEAYEQSAYFLGMRVIETATLRAELAREREANQGLRQESEDNYEQGKKWGLRSAIELSVQQYQKDDNRWNRAIRQYRDAIEEARASLEPKSKPVATTS